MKLLFALFLSFLLALPAAAAPVSVPLTFSVTPTPPPPFTVTVSQPATVSGIAYTVTGTLTFTPVITSAWLPPSLGNPPPAGLAGLPNATIGPMIAGYRDASGAWVSAFRPGDVAYIEGLGWGSAPGTVAVNSQACTVGEWTDQEIGVTLPTSGPLSPGGAFVEVRRPDGPWYSCLGFVVEPGP